MSGGYESPSKIFAVNPDGTMRWSKRLASDFAPQKAPVLSADGMLYLVTEGVIYAFGISYNTPLAVVSTTPDNGGTDEYHNGSAILTFNKEIYPGPRLDGIKAARMDAGCRTVEDIPVQTSISANTLIISSNDIFPMTMPGATYSITVPAGAVVDVAGNRLSDDYYMQFTNRNYSYITRWLPVWPPYEGPDRPSSKWSAGLEGLVDRIAPPGDRPQRHRLPAH